VPAARRHAADAVHGLGLDDAADAVALLVCELATNAVKASAVSSGGRHDAGPRRAEIAVRLGRAAAGLVVEVWDGEPSPPVPAAGADPEAEGGRGLLLVEALSSGWGHCVLPAGGKTVWAVVAVGGPAEAAVPSAFPRRRTGHADRNAVDAVGDAHAGRGAPPQAPRSPP
jgi:hypothetical protein